MFGRKAAALMAALFAMTSVPAYASATEAASEKAASAEVKAEEETKTESSESQDAEENKEEDQKVAGADEMAPSEDLDDTGLVEVTAKDLQDGTYEIEVDSSSSMFRITACTLTVEDGKMTAAMTMGGKGYLYLYMGTGVQAADASEEDYIAYKENEEGDHVYEVPIDSLNVKTDCAAFSKNREKWYDRTLIFRADLLSEEAYADEAKYDEVQAALPKKSSKKVLTVGRDEDGEVLESAKGAENSGTSGNAEGAENSELSEDVEGAKNSGDPEDEEADNRSIESGEYFIDVTLEGGSGRASVTSPCQLSVDDNGMTAVIEWSSPYYDYMIVDGEKYTPIDQDNTDNAVFEIPVAALDEEIPVIADTTAMSEPHEVEYTLTFDSGSAEKAE